MIDEEKNSFAISSRSNHKMSGLISKKKTKLVKTHAHTKTKVKAIYIKSMS